MFSTRAKSVLAVFLLVTFSAAISWSQKQPNTDKDSAAIKQCVAAWETAWNNHDAHATAVNSRSFFVHAIPLRSRANIV